MYKISQVLELKVEDKKVMVKKLNTKRIFYGFY